MALPRLAEPVRVLARALADVLDLGAEAGVAVGLLTVDALGAIPRTDRHEPSPRPRRHRPSRGTRPVDEAAGSAVRPSR